MTSQVSQPPNRQSRWWWRRPWRREQDPASISPPRDEQTLPLASTPLLQVEQIPKVTPLPIAPGRTNTGRKEVGNNRLRGNRTAAKKAILDDSGANWLGDQEMSRVCDLASKAIG